MSTGRPLSFDPQQAVEASMGVFWRQGYGATSLQDLLRATGLSKSSLYQVFGSKQQLFERCTRHYVEQLSMQLKSRLMSAESASLFLSNLFNELAEQAGALPAERGCLVMNTASEFAQSQPAMAELVNGGIEQFHSVFQAAVERGQREGEIGQAHSSSALASYLLSSITGLRTMAKAGADRHQLHETGKIVLNALN